MADIFKVFWTKLIPALLAPAVIWIMTSINDLQVHNAKIEQQQATTYHLLQYTATSLDEIKKETVQLQINNSVLEQRFANLEKFVDRSTLEKIED